MDLRYRVPMAAQGYPWLVNTVTGRKVCWLSCAVLSHPKEPRRVPDPRDTPDRTQPVAAWRPTTQS